MTQDPPAARVELHEGWGELILARPDRRNALAGPMVSELRAGLAQLLAGGARVIVLRGEGGAFCSGLDVDAFAARPAPDWLADWPEEWAGFHRELYRCPAVIVGALERFAINAGAALALACDLLVAGEGAYLLVGEAAIGMYAPMNLAWLRLKTSEAVAAQLALGATRVPAADLWRLGLVHKLVADAEVTTEAQALAIRLAGYPGQGLAAIKSGLRRPAPAGEGVFEALLATGHATAGPSRVTG
ncbi:enoyl-CoA hydratase/isomerase family protein [Phenylobacterium sp. 20VBR1]|uniref:Enoyl-CoA hydratase/isomerase family protein n=1 Tax=Phenylobacterium glaciei TaxID=2803784 RepID=A0A941HY21_9CAUL|nr:enoyl-CoA hydratase/isomerase family protein [Phenylobacterium glaciei]MBR7620912.1 enoyl-CoA hydratase/isomerase family protein [Phenylobacterium glaciei]